MFYNIRATRHRTQALRNTLPEKVKLRAFFFRGACIFSSSFRVSAPSTLGIVGLASPTQVKLGCKHGDRVAEGDNTNGMGSRARNRVYVCIMHDG
jgi:hypothetical protein